MRPEAQSSQNRKVVSAQSPASMVEMGDPSDEEQYKPFEQRTMWEMALKTMLAQGMDRDVLSKLRPLELRLRKSSSLEDLINAKLNEQHAAVDSDIKNSYDELEPQRKIERSARASAGENKKATSCHATVLSIGPWEFHSTYEGDLLAKFYYASHKLVWEILHDGLKSKIEIHWSDISTLRATCSKDGPDAMELLLLRAPTFFREVNPQPKKHTIWQACSDFTGGHAKTYRRHILQCKSGLLAKHFEKLIQCDPHLNAISQQSDILLRNLFYEPTFLNFWDQHELNHQFPDYVKNAYGYQVEGFLESPLSCASVPTYYGYPVEGFLESPLSCASVLASFQTDLSRLSLPAQADYSLGPGIEDKESEGNFNNETMRSIDRNQEPGDEITVPRLPHSISMTDFLLESEPQSSANMCTMPLLEEVPAGQDMILKEIAQQLLSDSHMSEFDERSVMSKVDSLCSLLHREDATTSTRHIGNGDIATDNGRNYENIVKLNPAIGIHAITDGFIPMQSTGTSRTSLKGLLNQSHISRSLQNLMNIPLRFP